MNSITPQQLKKLELLANIIDNGDVGVLDELSNLNDRIDNILSVNKGDKGEQGEMGNDGLQGEKGDKGDRGLDGKTGLNGRDGRDGSDGIDGRDGRDGSPDTGSAIVNKINGLSTDSDNDKIDIDHIKGLITQLNDIRFRITNIPSGRGFIGGGGSSQVYHDSTLSGSGTQASPLSVIGGGWTIETPTGTLYNQDTGTDGLIFTSTATATAVFVDGATYFDGCGCTISGTTITLDNPATQFIRVAI